MDNIVNIIKNTASAKNLKLRGVKVEKVAPIDYPWGYAVMVTVSYIARKYENNHADYKVVLDDTGAMMAYLERTYYA